MPGDHENILAVSNFRSWLKQIRCTIRSVTLTFNNNDAYSYAKEAWQWVNVENNNTFALITGAGDCGWNTVRQPFTIFTISFDDRSNAIYLQGNASTWENIAHTYELWVGKTPSTFARRNIDKSLTIDFNHPLPASSWTFSLPD